MLTGLVFVGPAMDDGSAVALWLWPNPNLGFSGEASLEERIRTHWDGSPSAPDRTIYQFWRSKESYHHSIPSNTVIQLMVLPWPSNHQPTIQPSWSLEMIIPWDDPMPPPRFVGVPLRWVEMPQGCRKSCAGWSKFRRVVVHSLPRVARLGWQLKPGLESSELVGGFEHFLFCPIIWD